MSNSMFVFNQKKVKELPMVDIAYEILKQSKNNYYFHDLLKEIANIRGMSEEEVMDNIAQLFTEINIDGRFVHLGQNEWGLKTWYPVDQSDLLHFNRDDDEEEEEDFDEDYEEDFDEESDEDEEEEEEDDSDEDEDLEDDSDEDFDEDEEELYDEEYEDSEEEFAVEDDEELDDENFDEDED